MPKKATDQSNGNALKPVIREVVQEELKPLREEIKQLHDEIKTTADTIIEGLQEALHDTFQKYRDETLSKMSEMVAEVKTYREEQTPLPQLGTSSDIYLPLIKR